MPSNYTTPRICPTCGNEFLARTDVARRGGGVYCSVRCFHDRPNVHRHHDSEALFTEKVEKTDTCWLWTAHCMKNGYGTLTVGGKRLLAHRFSWELHNGPIPADMQVLHRCDIRNCVNPEHLWLGTNAENRADSVEKGRQARGEAMHAVKGESCHSAILTQENVLAIRRSHALGEMTQKELAIHYGTSARTISKVILRQTWKHLPPEEF